MPFQGTHVDTFYSDQYDALTLDGTALIDDQPDFDAILVIDFLGTSNRLALTRSWTPSTWDWR